MAQAFFTYGRKSVQCSLLGLSPSIVASKLSVNVAELYLIDSSHKLITVENDHFDSELQPNELYNVYDDREIPPVEMNVVAPLANNHALNFKKSLQIITPVENIESNIKLQGLALVTMNAKDFSLEPGNYKHIKNLKSLRAAVHDLTSAVTKTYLETTNSAAEVHAGLNNILKGVPDMLKEVDHPNTDSNEVLEDLETWMHETLQECFEQSKKGTIATENLLEHIQELEIALIASLGAKETKSNSNEVVDEEKLQLLKKQQKRFEQAKMEAKLQIDNAWKAKMVDKDVYEEYDAANKSSIEKMRQISDLEFKIEQVTKNGTRNEDVLNVLRESIKGIQDVKENWRNAASIIQEMKNKLKVEKDAGRWKNATESTKIDLNKRHLIENMLEFLSIGYKVDYWMNVQNQITNDYLLTLASSATNVFSGGKALRVKNDVPKMNEQAIHLIKTIQSEMVKEYEDTLQQCLSLYSVVTIFQSDSSLYKM